MPRRCVRLLEWKQGVGTYGEKQVWVAVQNDNAEGVKPLPHLLRLLLAGKSLKFLGSLLMDSLGLQKEAECSGGGCQSGLEPENVSPTTESDDDAANEGT